MTRTIEKDKWSLRRHTKDFSKLCIVAEAIKYFTNASISDKDKQSLQEKLKEQGLYNERNPTMPLDAIDHKIRDLAFYMFGYRETINKEKKFLFSPLGNLFLKHLENKEYLKKIFFTMLWGMQFEHPESSTVKVFQLYPFRLIFKLLSEPILNNRLYAFEVSYIVMFTTHVNSINDYNSLVQNILNLRSMSNDEIKDLFEKDSHALVNAVYEWDYYSSNVLQSAGVLNRIGGETICRLKQGNTATYRKVTKNYCTLNEDLLELYNDLNNNYPFDMIPLQLDSSSKLKFDVIKEIYTFFPQILLSHIGESSEDIKIMEELLELPKLIEQYSNNNDGKEAYLFEDILEDGFNMFYNVSAKKIGGAGNTDLECLYNTDSINKKFAVDAKSTKNKLSGINAGRMRGHREKIGGQYTIVITPRYVPAVKQDIKGTETVLLLASTFSEYLYNCINTDLREIDYEAFDDIITDNLGTDISKNISQLTFSQFATTN